ncbi:MAG: hypothetical protein FWF24_03375 [Alphaproteobacteria bacterium]|nr:hypothetical protein [Alphaproteobacteria bacterium]
MTRFSLGFLAFVGVLVLAGQAWAETAPCDPRKEVCIGRACDPVQRGVTLLDFDKKNILACLAGADGTTYYWKQNSIGNMKCAEGQTLQGIEAGQPVCVTAAGGGGSVFVVDGLNYGAGARRKWYSMGWSMPACPGGLMNLSFWGGIQVDSFGKSFSNEVCCLAPNPATGQCSCPESTIPIVLKWDDVIVHPDERDPAHKVTAINDSGNLGIPSLIGCFAAPTACISTGSISNATCNALKKGWGGLHYYMLPQWVPGTG